MKTVLKSNAFNWLVVCLSGLLYFFLTYELDRSQFSILLTGVLILFITSCFLIKNDHFNSSQLFGIAIFFRLLLLVAIPNLSQDFYRFIWDGRMLFNGSNPYLTTPKSLVEQGLNPITQAQELFKGMGMLNASHYTNYPPVSQLSYFIAALFGSKSILTSVILLRLQIILADIGIFYVGKKILKHLQLPVKYVFIYFLNPFIIIELVGNLHFESVMVFFLLSSIYLLLKKHWVLAAVFLGLSVSVKLIPLIFLPLFFVFFLGKKLSIRQLFKKKERVFLWQYISFCILVLGTTIITFLPFVSAELISNFGASISLWFQNFEFNASIYYIIRWIGFKVVGWNIIGTVGKILPLVVILLVSVFSLARRNYDKHQLILSMLMSICCYLMLSTTVHPWYLAVPLALSMFTSFRFVWVWTFTVFLSYNAYRLPNFNENLVWVALEYSIVIVVFLLEVFGKRKRVYC